MGRMESKISTRCRYSGVMVSGIVIIYFQVMDSIVVAF